MKQRWVWIGLSAVGLVLGAGCGSDDGDGGPDPTVRACEEGGVASTDSYLPYVVGNVWRYNVVEAVGDPPTTKRQELVEEITPEGETEPVIVQRTIKATGITESWLRHEGDVLVRLRQQDFDPEGMLEQTTTYDPPKIRIDESPEHITASATWTETYQRVVVDPDGVELSNLQITDAWTVLAEDALCGTPWGDQSCLHLRVERIEGGVSNKEFYFARGYGKVRETGGQLEELIACELD